MREHILNLQLPDGIAELVYLHLAMKLTTTSMLAALLGTSITSHLQNPAKIIKPVGPSHETNHNILIAHVKGHHKGLVHASHLQLPAGVGEFEDLHRGPGRGSPWDDPLVPHLSSA